MGTPLGVFPGGASDRLNVEVEELLRMVDGKLDSMDRSLGEVDTFQEVQKPQVFCNHCPGGLLVQSE